MFLHFGIKIVLLWLLLLRHVHYPGGGHKADRDRDGLPLLMLLLQLLLLQPWLSPDVGLILILLAMHNKGRSEITP